MCCLGCNLEDLDFFDLEIIRTRENDPPVQPGVVGVSDAKRSPIPGAAVIGNINVTTSS
jgi:hypothetical protein